MSPALGALSFLVVSSVTAGGTFSLPAFSTLSLEPLEEESEPIDAPPVALLSVPHSSLLDARSQELLIPLTAAMMEHHLNPSVCQGTLISFFSHVSHAPVSLRHWGLLHMEAAITSPLVTEKTRLLQHISQIPLDAWQAHCKDEPFIDGFFMAQLAFYFSAERTEDFWKVFFFLYPSRSHPFGAYFFEMLETYDESAPGIIPSAIVRHFSPHTRSLIQLFLYLNQRSMWIPPREAEHLLKDLPPLLPDTAGELGTLLACLVFPWTTSTHFLERLKLLRAVAPLITPTSFRAAPFFPYPKANPWLLDAFDQLDDAQAAERPWKSRVVVNAWTKILQSRPLTPQTFAPYPFLSNALQHLFASGGPLRIPQDAHLYWPLVLEDLRQFLTERRQLCMRLRQLFVLS